MLILFFHHSSCLFNLVKKSRTFVMVTPSKSKSNLKKLAMLTHILVVKMAETLKNLMQLSEQRTLRNKSNTQKKNELVKLMR